MLHFPRRGRAARTLVSRISQRPGLRRPLTLAVHLALAPLVLAPQALAQTQGAYDIPAGPLANALTRFIGESGIFLSGTAELARDKTSPGLRGSHSPEQGLAELLRGTGLEAVRQADGSYVLRAQPAPAAGEAAVLRKMVVKTVADNTATTEGTGSYTTGSTSAATKLNLSLRETPQSVSIITRQRMDDQGLQELADVVARTPGLVMNQSGNLGSDSSAIYARGFQVENYQVDGVSQVYSNYSGIFQTNDMALYDRVEVVRGATGLMNGIGTPAATINLVRKHGTEQAQVSLRAEVGSWDHYRGELDAGAPLTASGNVRGRLVAVYQESGSYIDRLDERKKILYGIVDADLTPNTSASLGFTLQDQDFSGHARSGRPLFNADGGRAHWSRSDSAAADWAYSRRHSQNFFGSLEHRFDNDWLLKASLSRAISDYDEVLGYAAGGNAHPDGSGINLWAGRWAGAPVQDTVDVFASGAFELFGRSHDLVLGVTSSNTVDKTDTYNLWWFDDWDSSVPDIYHWRGDNPAAPHNPAGGKMIVNERVDSAYVTARFKPTDALSLIVGARSTNWLNHTGNRSYGSAAVSRDDRVENGEVTPYIGVVYDIDRHWSAYASYTDIFKPQSNRSESGSFLDPLIGQSYEIGAKGAFLDDRLNVSGAVYTVKQDNLAVAIDGVFAPDGSQAYRAVSGTETRGFELEVAGELAPGWQAQASFSRALSEDREGSRLNTNIPQNTAKLFTTYRFADIGNGLTVGGGARWQSNIYSDNQGPNQVRFTQGSYTVVDFLVRYPVTEQVTASFNLYNAFDSKYFTSTSSSFYGAPRNARLGVDVRF